MYNLPEMRAVNARFWGALRGLLVEAGLRDVPETLSFDRSPVPKRIGPEILFSQTCGYPLETIFPGQAIRLGTPCYAAPGCEGPSHCAFFVVPEMSPAMTLADLKGSRYLLNSPVSNSGMNLPRRRLAEIAGGGRLFSAVIETGGYPASPRPPLRGEGGVAADDCGDQPLWGHHPPQAGVRGGRPG